MRIKAEIEAMLLPARKYQILPANDYKLDEEDGRFFPHSSQKNHLTA